MIPSICLTSLVPLRRINLFTVWNVVAMILNGETKRFPVSWNMTSGYNGVLNNNASKTNKCPEKPYNSEKNVLPKHQNTTMHNTQSSVNYTCNYGEKCLRKLFLLLKKKWRPPPVRKKPHTLRKLFVDKCLVISFKSRKKCFSHITNLHTDMHQSVQTVNMDNILFIISFEEDICFFLF